MRPLTPKPFLQGMSRGETRSNRSDIKIDGKASTTSVIRDIITIIKGKNGMSEREARPFVIASTRMINSALGHNL